MLYALIKSIIWAAVWVFLGLAAYGFVLGLTS